NEINKQLGRGGENKVILLRQILKSFLKSIIKEAQSINGSEEIWAGDLLYSWCLNGRMKAANALGIPLEKLPTTNNHLEGMNEYLKNNQLNRFQRCGHLLRADILYIALVYELLMQEFSQVAYLSPSIKQNELAKKLLEMKKPTDICCQYFDFLQTGILCKHLHAAALYINKLRKQEQYMYLPEITFPTYQEAQQIYYNQYADRSEMPISSEINNEDNDNVDDENENIDNKSNNHDNNDNITSPFNIPESTEPISNKANIDTLNTTAICKQEFKEFLESTLRSLQILQENSILFQNLIESEQLSMQELYNMNDNRTLMTHLRDLIASSSFKEVQNLVDIMYKDTNPHRHVTSGANILPLEREIKQQWRQSYKS
ncbi:18681_t:CDS:2, partial [Racocetra persica]